MLDFGPKLEYSIFQLSLIISYCEKLLQDGYSKQTAPITCARELNQTKTYFMEELFKRAAGTYPSCSNPGQIYNPL